MAHKAFLYPEWFKAKRGLVDALMNAKRDEIPGVVLDWFERHVFEVGTSFTYDNELIGRSKIDIEKEAEYRAQHGLVNEILKNGFYTNETYSEYPFRTIKKWRVLVFGAPELVIRNKIAET